MIVSYFAYARKSNLHCVYLHILYNSITYLANSLRIISIIFKIIFSCNIKI